MRPGSGREEVARAVQVSRWMNAHGVSAVEALDVRQPVEAHELLVTFWRSTGDGDRYGSTVDLARLLSALHGLDEPSGIELPGFDPFGIARNSRAPRRFVSGPIRARHPKVPTVVMVLAAGSIGAPRGTLRSGHFAAMRWHHRDDVMPKS
jgi:hypothetical protein